MTTLTEAAQEVRDMESDQRNARAMRSAQLAYDNMAPPDDDDITDHLDDDDYAEAEADLIEDGWEEPTAEQIEARAVSNYERKWSDC